MVGGVSSGGGFGSPTPAVTQKVDALVLGSTDAARQYNQDVITGSPDVIAATYRGLYGTPGQDSGLSGRIDIPAGQKPLATSAFAQAMNNPLREAQTRLEYSASLDAQARAQANQPNLSAFQPPAPSNMSVGQPYYSPANMSIGQPYYSPSYQSNVTPNLSIYSNQAQQNQLQNQRVISNFQNASPMNISLFGVPPNRDASTVLGSGYGRTPQQQAALDAAYRADQARAAVNAGLSPEAGSRMNINYRGKGAYTAQVLSAIAAEDAGKKYTPQGSTPGYIYRRFGASAPQGPPTTMPEVRSVAVRETSQLYAAGPQQGPLQRLADNTFGFGPSFAEEARPTYARTQVEVARAPATFTNAPPRQSQADAILAGLTSSTPSLGLPTQESGKTTISAPLSYPTSVKEIKSYDQIRKSYDEQTSVSTPTVTPVYESTATGVKQVGTTPSKTFNLPASSYDIYTTKEAVIITNRPQLVAAAVQKSMETGLPIRNIDTGAVYPSAKNEYPSVVSNQILREMPAAKEYQSTLTPISSGTMAYLEARKIQQNEGLPGIKEIGEFGSSAFITAITALPRVVEADYSGGQSRLKTGDWVEEFSEYSKGKESALLSYIPIVGQVASETFEKNVGGLSRAGSFAKAGGQATLEAATNQLFLMPETHAFMKANPDISLGLPLTFGTAGAVESLKEGYGPTESLFRGAVGVVVPMAVFQVAGAKISGTKTFDLPAINVEQFRHVNIAETSSSQTSSGQTSRLSGYADVMYKRLPNVPGMDRLPRFIVERLPGKRTAVSSTLDVVADIQKDPTSFSPIIGAKPGGKTVMKVQATVDTTAYPGRAIEDTITTSRTATGVSLKGKIPYFQTEPTKPLGSTRPQSYELVPAESFEPSAQRLEPRYKLGTGATASGVGSPQWTEQNLGGWSVKLEAEPTARVETTQVAIKNPEHPDIIYETSFEEGTGLKKPRMEVSGPAASEQIKLISEVRRPPRELKSGEIREGLLALRTRKFSESSLKQMANEAKPSELPVFKEHEPFYSKKIDLEGKYSAARRFAYKSLRTIGLDRSVYPPRALDKAVGSIDQSIEFGLAKKVGSVKSLSFRKGTGTSDSILYHTTEITDLGLMRDIRSGKTTAVSVTADEINTVFGASIKRSQLSQYAQNKLANAKNYVVMNENDVPVASILKARLLEISTARSSPRDPAAFFTYVKTRIPVKFAPEPNTPSLLGFKSPKVTLTPIIDELTFVASKPTNLEPGQPEVFGVKNPTPTKTVLRSLPEGGTSRKIVEIESLPQKPGPKAKTTPTSFNDVFPDVTPPSGKATTLQFTSANPMDWAAYKPKGAAAQSRPMKGFGGYRPVETPTRGFGASPYNAPKGETPSPSGFDLGGEFPPKPSTSGQGPRGEPPSGGMQARMNQEYSQSQQARSQSQVQLWEEQRPSTQLTDEMRAAVGSAIKIRAPEAKPYSIEIPKFEFPEAPQIYRTPNPTVPYTYISPAPQKVKTQMDTATGLYQFGKTDTKPIFEPGVFTPYSGQKPVPPVPIIKPTQPPPDVITGTKQDMRYFFWGGNTPPPYNPYAPTETPKGRRASLPVPFFPAAFPGMERGGGPGYGMKKSQYGTLYSVLGIPTP